MRSLIISRGNLIPIFLGLSLLILVCFCDKITDPDEKIPHEITFQKTALDSLNILMVASDFNGNIFATASTGHGSDLFRSKDKGETWAITLPRYTINNMAFKDNGDILAGTQDGIYRSSDNSNSWIKVFGESSENLRRPLIIHLAINPINNDLYSASTWEIFRSIDNGENWMKIEWPTIYSQIMSLVINSRGNIFIAVFEQPGTETQNGLFYSTDEGENWKKIDKGIENVIVDHLASDPSGYLYAGTRDNGVFRTKYSITE